MCRFFFFLFIGLLTFSTNTSTVFAWCQSLSETRISRLCHQPCLRIEDFTEVERQKLKVVELFWTRRCFELAIHEEGSQHFTLQGTQGNFSSFFSHLV